MNPEELEKRVASLEKRLRELEENSWMTLPLQPRCIPTEESEYYPEEVHRQWQNHFIVEPPGFRP